MSNVSLERYYFVLYDGALTLKMSKMALNAFCDKTLHVYINQIINARENGCVCGGGGGRGAWLCVGVGMHVRLCVSGHEDHVHEYELIIISCIIQYNFVKYVEWYSKSFNYFAMQYAIYFM